MAERLQVVHVIEQLTLGGPLYALVGACRGDVDSPSDSHRIISLLRADQRAVAHAASAGIEVISAPGEEALRQMLGGADIVQVHFWNNPAIHAFLESDLPPVRVLVWCHVNGLHAPHVLPRSLFPIADVVAVSSEVSLDLPAFQSADPEQVALLFAGADFSRIDGIERIEHEAFTIGYVGLVDFAKLHAGFVRMCAAVKARPIRILVCGGGGDRATIRRQAEDAGIAGEMVLLDHAEDVRPVLGQLDALVYPLCPETVCTSELALQEAMYAGVPPIVFPHGGIPKLVTHQRNALVATDEDEFVRAIEQLATDAAERKRLGENAAIDARASFGSQKTAHELRLTYARLMGKDKRARPGRASNASETRNTGTLALIRSLDGVGDGDLLCSLANYEDSAGEAEERIGNAGANMKSVILHYRVHYPDDAWLRLWTGLLFLRDERRALAAMEFKICIALGLDQPRVHRYFTRARQA